MSVALRVVTILVVAVAALMAWEYSFLSQCPDPTGTHASDDCSMLRGPAGSAVSTGAAWLGAVLNRNRDGLNLAFIIALAAFIAALWWSMRKLWKINARTLEAIQKSERPYVFLEITEPGIDIHSSGLMSFAGRFRFRFTNYGKMPAFLHEIREEHIVIEGKSDLPPPIDPKTDRGDIFPAGTISAPAAPYKLASNLLNAKNGLRMLERNAWADRRMFFEGFVRFSDPFGNRYITGFLACFMPEDLGWVLIGEGSYNYTRRENVADIPAPL